MSGTSVNSGNERLRIVSTGNVGINTSTPNKQLTVSGDVSATGYYYGDGSLLTGIQPGAATVSFNPRSDTSYTIVTDDNGKTIASTNTSGLTAIISSSTSYTTGFNVSLLQLTTGRITVSAQNGFTTINQSNGFYQTTKQYSAATLLYTGSTGWVLFGDLAS